MWHFRREKTTLFDSAILHPYDRAKYFPLFMVCKMFVKPWYVPALKTLYSVFSLQIFKHVAEFWTRRNIFLGFQGEVWFCTVFYSTRQPSNILIFHGWPAIVVACSQFWERPLVPILLQVKDKLHSSNFCLNNCLFNATECNNKNATKQWLYSAYVTLVSIEIKDYR